MGVLLVPQGLCWGRVTGKGSPSLHSLPEEAVAAEELHRPPPISSQTWVRGKVHPGNLGQWAYWASLGEQSGFGLQGGSGRRAKASLLQLFHSSEN